LSSPHTVEINWQDKGPQKILASRILTGKDLKAGNSFESPKKVTAQDFEAPVTTGGKTRFQAPPQSYIAMQWQF
jgi:alpha-L-arabinofuranosidase